VLIYLAAPARGAQAALVQLDVVQQLCCGHVHKEAAKLVANVIRQKGGVGDGLQRGDLRIVQRAVAVVFIGVVIKLLERQAQPTGCTLTPTGIGTDDGADHLATGFKNLAGHLLLPLCRGCGVG